MSDDKIELLIVGPWDGTGGIQTYISQQVDNLPDEVVSNVYNTEVSGDGVLGVFRIMFFNLIRAMAFPFGRDPDLVHIHTAHNFSFIRKSYYVLVSRYILGVPTILHIHGSSFDEFLNTDSTILKTLQDIVFRVVDEVIVLSPYWEDIVTHATPCDEVTVLPNGVNFQKFDSHPNTKNPKLVFISNLIERKGVHEFLQVIETDLPEMDDWQIDIGGDGPLALQVKDKAAKADSITYHGYVPEDKKRELLKQSSIFILPSHAENLPISLIEAMAAGNAIVSTDVGAIPGLVQDGGIIVPAGDDESLSAALRELMSDLSRVEDMGDRNRERIKESYNWEYLTPELVSLYEGMLDDE